MDKIIFTGSSETGREIMRIAAGSVKRIGLELGGKSATIVLDDAPFDDAVRSALKRISVNQGENCAAGSRLLIQRGLYDRFIAAIADAASRLVIGDPQATETDLGPLVTAHHLSRVQRYMDAAASEAKAIFLGTTPDAPPFDRGFFAPLSIWEAGPRTQLWREEVFGPVLATTMFGDEAEAVALANDSQFGLLATIWCGDRGRGMRMAREINCGMVRVNNARAPIHGPWGGFKASGIGRTYGRHGLDASTEVKQINVDLS